jgi:hypothetical protein
MILHDVCDLKFIRLDGVGDPVETETIPDVPVEFTPLVSNSVDPGAVVTKYTAYMSVDPSELAAGLSFTPSKVEVWYNGQLLQLDAGFERHRMLGRFHHVEFVVRDFGKFGAS